MPSAAPSCARSPQLIDDNAAELAELEARDGGGTIRKAMLADVPGAQSAFEWFAQLRRDPARPGRPRRARRSPSRSNYVRYEPIGVSTGIIPWNFPLIMAAWKIAPSIAAGNCSVIKPASFTSLTALKLAELIAEADLPPGVVNVLAGPGGTLGEELASNPLVDKTAFTGSTEVGRRIMQLASGNVKPVTLELGGKSANIVLDDADLDLAAAARAVGHVHARRPGVRVRHPGARAARHLRRVRQPAGRPGRQDRARRPARHGHRPRPARVSRSQVETVERYVALGRDEVGEPITGGAKPEGLPEGLDRDAFFQPTIFTDVDNSAKIAQEEIFGPVLCVIPFDSDDEAVAIANDSIYGLGGGVQSGNLERAEAVAAGMRTGTVWINDYHLIDPERPFGGYKQSGIGRELGTQGYDDLPPGQARAHQPRDLRARQPLPLRRAQRQHLSPAPRSHPIPVARILAMVSSLPGDRFIAERGDGVAAVRGRGRGGSRPLRGARPRPAGAGARGGRRSRSRPWGPTTRSREQRPAISSLTVAQPRVVRELRAGARAARRGAP